MKTIVYPFTAIVGQNRLKRALLFNVINPRVGGVLINGQKGTAKSTAVRALSNLLKKEITEVPLSVTEDRLVGSVDLEKTIESGKICFEEGLLKKADLGIVYVDEVNLLKEDIVNILLEVSANKVNHIEREGISFSHPSRFLLVGTMNAEEGFLRPQFLDRFGLFVQVETEKNVDKRVEIVQRRMQYEEDPESFCASYEKAQNYLIEKIEAAIKRLEMIHLSEEELKSISLLCRNAGVDGHRADLIMIETIRAIMAFDDLKEMTAQVVDEAKSLVFPHRQKDVIHRDPPKKEDQKEDVEEEDRKEEENQQEPEEDLSNPENEADENREDEEGPDQDKETGDPVEDEQMDDLSDLPNLPPLEEYEELLHETEAAKTYQVKDFAMQADRMARRGQGKRTLIRSAQKSGSYIRTTQQRLRNDLALDATIRAAAVHQQRRKSNGMAIVIHDEDIREKIRQKRMSNLLVFVVDASGSMRAHERMVETKGAILSLLEDSYVKRDKVALVMFRGMQGEVILPPTRSVERGYQLMQNMKVGGRTALNAGIAKGIKVIDSEKRKDMDLLPVLIIVTDGKGNVSIDPSKKPYEELMEIGEKIAGRKDILKMVIDIEKEDMMSLGIAKQLSDVLGAEYRKVEDLKKENLLQAVLAIRADEDINYR